MTDILRPVLELSVIIPGILLAYLPVKSYLRQTPLKHDSMASSSSSGNLYFGRSGLLCPANSHQMVPVSSAACDYAHLSQNTENLYLEICQYFSCSLRSFYMCQKFVPGS